MNTPEANIRVPVDLTNPGQFFACCGMLGDAARGHSTLGSLGGDATRCHTGTQHFGIVKQ